MLEISVEWKSFANYWNTHVELKIFNPHKRSHKSKEKGPLDSNYSWAEGGCYVALTCVVVYSEQRVKINAINAT